MVSLRTYKISEGSEDKWQGMTKDCILFKQWEMIVMNHNMKKRFPNRIPNNYFENGVSLRS